MKINKLILILALVFILLSFNAFATIGLNTTFLGNSTSSSDASLYNATCGNSTTRLVNPCTNTTGWKTIDTEPNMIIEKGLSEFNLTATAGGGGGGGDNSVKFFTGGNYTKIGNHSCIDFNYYVPTDIDGVNLFIIWTTDLTPATTSNYNGIWTTGDGKWHIGVSGGDVDTFQNVVRPDPDGMNVTICQEDLIRVYFNNSEMGTASLARDALTGNITFFVQTGGLSTGNEKIRFRHVFVYPASGAPQAGAEAPPSIANNSPIITINSPLNNSASHNATIVTNFTISVTENNNLTWFIYLDKNSNPTTLINDSGNRTQGNYTLNPFTLNNDTEGSINGTYFLKFNGTNNASRFFEILFSFNLTNNITNYNVTNVTITTLPLEVGATATGHCNITSFSSEKNNASLIERIWWVNNTNLTTNINSTTLAGGNVTNNANITFMCRVNNGYGNTAWTVFVNSSTATVGDTITPTISGQSINGNSFTTSQRVNVTVNCTDDIVVDIVRVEWNRTGSYANDTMTLLNLNQYSYTALFSVGNYNATKFYCRDGGSNMANDTSNFTFSVTSPPSSSGGTSGGGGGGTTIVVIKQIGIPLLSFGGLTLIDFPVLRTPSKSTKLVRFKNVGNLSYANANVFVEGDAKRFIKPFVCNLNMQNCTNRSINILAGETKFLSLNGTFDNTLGEGVDGIVKIQEQKDNGKTTELKLLISRPPLHRLLISPITKATSFDELYVLIAVYVALLAGTMLVIFILLV